MFWAFIGRCFCGFLSDVTLFLAFSYTAFGRAICVGKLETVFQPFIAAYVLSEAVEFSDVVAAVAVLAGVSLITEPWKGQWDAATETDTIGIVWGLLASVIGGWLFVFCRRISDKIHYSVSLLYYLTLSCICTPLLAWTQTEIKVSALAIYDNELYLYILSIVVIFYIHMVLMHASWQYNTAGATGVLLYLCIPFSYYLESLVIGRSVGTSEVIGAGLIFVTNVSVVTLRLFKFIN